MYFGVFSFANLFHSFVRLALDRSRVAVKVLLFASFNKFIASIASHAPNIYFFIEPNCVGSIIFFMSSAMHILVRRI